MFIFFLLVCATRNDCEWKIVRALVLLLYNRNDQYEQF